MKALPDNSVDSIVTDPPYGISFMAKKWDYDVPSVEVWQEAMRVLKPGGHALIACGTRTQHRMVCNIEDAGFEIRDVVSWIYGSGFPKSLNIHKKDERCPDGWGTALKPACEFFTLARKLLSEKTVAANVLKWGTGGINIDGCRVATEDNRDRIGGGTKGGNGCYGNSATYDSVSNPQGRFPANLIHDGSSCSLIAVAVMVASRLIIQARNITIRKHPCLMAISHKHQVILMILAQPLASFTALRLPRRIETRATITQQSSQQPSCNTCVALSPLQVALS